MARSGWESKSASYRSRLTGAGRTGLLTGQPLTAAETQAYWEMGGDLRAGRSHARSTQPLPEPVYRQRYGRQRPRRVTGAAPAEATNQEALGLGGPGTMAELERWRARPPSRGGPPAWIPKDPNQLGTDVAAILSQIDIHPRNWRAVEFAFQSGSEVVVTITPKRGYPRVIILPDASAVEEFGRLIKSPALMAQSPAEARRLAEEWARKAGEGIDVNTTGYRKSPAGRAA